MNKFVIQRLRFLLQITSHENEKCEEKIKSKTLTKNLKNQRIAQSTRKRQQEKKKLHEKWKFYFLSRVEI